MAIPLPASPPTSPSQTSVLPAAKETCMVPMSPPSSATTANDSVASVGAMLLNEATSPDKHGPPSVQSGRAFAADLASLSGSTSASIISSLHNSPTVASISDAAHSYFGSSSIVPSPEPLHPQDLTGLDFGAPGLSTFQLPESILSHKLSATSLHKKQPPLPTTTNGSAPQEGVKQNNNLIRRLSNRASRAIARRRPSSTHPKSRDASVGPGILRRRSDSTSTAPTSDIMERPSLFDTDSDYDADERDGSARPGRNNMPVALSPVRNGPMSSDAFATLVQPPMPAQMGPVIPLALLHGMPIRKVSKKNNKRLVLTLDADAGRIVWNKHRSKYIYIDDIKEIRTGGDIRQYRLDCNVPEADEPHFFSILYTVPDTKQTKLIHLITDTDESFRDWTTTLDAIYKYRQDFMATLMSFNDMAVRTYWNREVAKSSDKVSTSSSGAELGEIDFPGVERVCRNLHIHVPQDVLRARFDEADAFQCGRLNYACFQEFVRLIKRRGDVQAIYRSIASNATRGITRAEFFDFLRNTQGENVDDELPTWEFAFARFANRVKVAEKALTVTDTTVSDAQSNGADDLLRMSEAGLAGYLTSTYNLSTIKEPKDYVLDRPMHEYYISSSHNTYLVGRQLAGTSSVEGYIAALTRGCRCVEIDCWDGADGLPIVVHGKTWTSSISFREAVNAINKYAFVTSPFPLWISLEVHCNTEQQRIMARIMRDVFGSALVTEPLPSATNRLPSPSELKYRILVKTKKTQQPLSLPPLPPLPPFPPQTASEIIANSFRNSGSGSGGSGTGKGVGASVGGGGSEFIGRRRGNSLPSPFQKALTIDASASPLAYSPVAIPQASPLSHTGQASPVLSAGHIAPATPRKTSTPRTRMNTINPITEGEVQREVQRDMGGSSGTSDCDSGGEKSPPKQRQSKIAFELGCLAVYCVGVHKATTFDAPDCKMFNHILSWDETVYDKFTRTRESRRALAWHNMRYMMRVYPKPYRIGSSNFNPLSHWRRGVQMAALNWQTYDLGMQLNAAMFTGGTDQSGYVLKPRECRGFHVLPNLPGESKPRGPKRERKNVNFSIGIVSAQQLMRPASFPERRTLDPYVEVEVFLADDKQDRDDGIKPSEHLPTTPLVCRTKIARENGFNPNFDQRFNFSFTTKYPDLVFVRMSVKLADNRKYTSSNPTATFTAKLSNLKQGYRTIPLVDVNADRYMFSTLFCEIHKEPITSVYVPCAADAPESTNKLKSIRTVFNRSANMSPKSSLDRDAL